MAALMLKVKSKTGQHVIKDLNLHHSILDLKKELSSRCKIPENALNVLSGFPPKPLDLKNLSLTLEDSGLHSGDTLIVDERTQEGEGFIDFVPKSVSQSINPAPSVPDFDQQLTARGILLRKVVPADNSCLFTSVGFVLSGKIETDCGDFMRQLIVEHVKADPENFNEAILGKAPADYCRWIMNSDTWGGAIELCILSKYYGVEIAVVDTVNGIINRFGEDQSYPHRVLLIFDGIHYDPLYLESVQTGDMQTLFPADDLETLADAKTLAEESKSSRQYTDVNKFSIKCMDCETVLKGQVEAQSHAKTTGHVSFGEV